MDPDRGIQAHFAEVNAKGCINGRPLRYVSLEDQADVEKARANFRTLANDGAVALLATAAARW